MRIRNMLPGLGVALTSVVMWAHHGSAVSYDLAQRVTMKGTITDFKYINPHPALFWAPPPAAAPKQ